MTYPRVSEVVKLLCDSYAGVPESVLEAAAQRGTSLHELCLWYLADNDNLMTRSQGLQKEFVQPYLGFLEWCTRRKPEALCIEQHDQHPTLRYQGTPDALVRIGKHDVLIDLKFTAQMLPSHHVQVQAYWHLPAYASATKAMVIHIHPESGQVKEYPVRHNSSDWAGFLGALNVIHWRTSQKGVAA